VFLTGSETLRTQVGSEEEVNALIERGSRMRAVSATRLNEVSSRSHTILTFHIEGQQADSNVTQFGKLHLVDLAGSERLKRSGAEGDTQKETLNINSSLTALADVLSALSAPAVGGQAPAVIPYRNSKLTRLLQEVFVKKTTAEWVDLLESAGVPNGPINNIAQVFAEPQVKARGVRLELANASGVKVPLVASPMRF
jgi:kinesin family protein C2/C3